MSALLRHRLLIPAIACTAAAVLILGFLYTHYRPLAPATPVEKLRIALSSSPHALLPLLALANGYFAEEGLEIEFTPASHGAAALNLVIEGKADLAATADVPIVIAVLNGSAIAVVTNVSSFSNENAIIARLDRGIRDPADLKQKKIGVTFGTSSDYFLWAFLIRNKVLPAAVTPVNVLPDQIAQTLKNGTVDAVATWQPHVSNAQAAMGQHILTFKAADVYTGSFSMVGLKSFLEKHPATIEKVLRALLKAETFNHARPQSAMDLYAARTQVDQKILAQTWQEFHFKIELRQSQLINLENQSGWAMSRGYADKRTIPNFLPILYLDALLAVRPDRVSVVR